MSLEDKAKEYAKNIWQSDDPRTEVDREHSAEDYEAGWRQAIDDLMERVKSVTCYSACCECYMTDDFFTLESLKEIAEDLKR